MSPNWFVAWPVVGAEEWIVRLERNSPGGLNFLAPADLHVTLAFLGKFDPALLGKISSLIDELPLKPVEVSLNQFIALPQPRRFSALAFVLGQGRLEVEKQIDKWRVRICREAGAKLETRPTMSHITVARPDRRIGEADRDASLEWMLNLPAQSDVRLQLGRPRLFTWAERDAPTRYRMLGGPESSS